MVATRRDHPGWSRSVGSRASLQPQGRRSWDHLSPVRQTEEKGKGGGTAGITRASIPRVTRNHPGLPLWPTRVLQFA